jgi:hypothetical protein
MDHSKRVSAKENMDALKAGMGVGRDKLIAWRHGRPVRRTIRRWNVFFMLATAGLLVSTAGLLFLVGVGQVQIDAAGGGSKNLFENWWVIIGCVVAVVGFLWGLAAVTTIVSQAAARKEFPDLVIRVLLRADYDGQEPEPPSGHGQPVRLAHVRLLVRNEERERDVTLPISIQFDTLPAIFPVAPAAPPLTATVTPLGFPAATWVPNPVDVPGIPGIQPLVLPLHVPAGTQIEGDIFFVIPQIWVPALSPNPQRGRVVVVDRKTDRSVDFEYGYPDDRIPR